MIQPMADDSKYHFRIGAYSPKTMPLGRLLMYLEQFKKLLPHPDKVHLINIAKGSTAPAFYIEPTYEDQTIRKIRGISQGDCTIEEKKAYSEIQHLGDEDAADKVAFISPDGAEIIQFPIKPRPSLEADALISGVKEQTTIFASAYKAGRQTSTSKKYDAWFTDIKNGGTIRAEMPIDLGVKLGGLLEQVLSVSGIAEWSRDEKGVWKIAKFTVQHFEEFHPRKINETFAIIDEIESSFPENIHKILDDHRNGD